MSGQTDRFMTASAGGRAGGETEAKGERDAYPCNYLQLSLTLSSTLYYNRIGGRGRAWSLQSPAGVLPKRVHLWPWSMAMSSRPGIRETAVLGCSKAVGVCSVEGGSDVKLSLPGDCDCEAAPPPALSPAQRNSGAVPKQANKQATLEPALDRA